MNNAQAISLFRPYIGKICNSPGGYTGETVFNIMRPRKDTRMTFILDGQTFRLPFCVPINRLLKVLKPVSIRIKLYEGNTLTAEYQINKAI